MDFTLGFHQIAMDKASAVLTAFIAYCGVYQFTRVPFGPKNAPSYYQQFIAGVVLAGILYLICKLYIDDCIVFGKNKSLTYITYEPSSNVSVSMVLYSNLKSASSV
jgi:hypothetical protein